MPSASSSSSPLSMVAPGSPSRSGSLAGLGGSSQRLLKRNSTLEFSEFLPPALRKSESRRALQKKKVFYPEATLPETQPEEAVDEGETMATLKAKLDMLGALDEIRDEHGDDPQAMLRAIVDHLAEVMSAQVVLLYIRDRKTEELKLEASSAVLATPPTASAVLAAFPTHASRDRPVITDGRRLPSLNLHGADAGRLLMSYITMDDSLLGVLVLARHGGMDPFTYRDSRSIVTALTQIDSAIVQGFSRFDMTVQNKVLEVIHSLHRTRQETADPDQYMESVLTLLREHTGSHFVALVTYNNGRQRFEMDSFLNEPPMAELPETWVAQIFKVARRCKDSTELQEDIDRVGIMSMPGAARNAKETEVNFTLCHPLSSPEGFVGVLAVVRRGHTREDGFTAFDHEWFSRLIGELDVAMFIPRDLKERQLEVLLALDGLRDDHADDPDGLLEAICKYLGEAFDADLAVYKADDSPFRDLPLGVSSTQNRMDMSELLVGRMAINDEPLGAVVLGRSGGSFRRMDRDLLGTALTQIDSAIVQRRRTLVLEGVRRLMTCTSIPEALDTAKWAGGWDKVELADNDPHAIELPPPKKSAAFKAGTSRWVLGTGTGDQDLLKLAGLIIDKITSS
jgi:hypothetical protein